MGLTKFPFSQVSFEDLRDRSGNKNCDIKNDGPQKHKKITGTKIQEMFLYIMSVLSMPAVIHDALNYEDSY